jgi:hypothetical protein
MDEVLLVTAANIYHVANILRYASKISLVILAGNSTV